MFDLHAYLSGLAALGVLVGGGWLASLWLKRVDIVDSLWSLMFLVAGVVYVYVAPTLTPRAELLLWMVGIWAVRLSVYLGLRCAGHEEDRRYRAMRARGGPRFHITSLWRIFGLQAALAWLISIPLLGAALGTAPLGLLDVAGAVLWLVGFVFEAGGDWQLARFKAQPGSEDKVMDRGFWRYTRHPNYFGDACMWWGFWLLALSAGAWWSFPGPALMTFLLLRVSGVTLLERSIGKRRPAYAEYVRRTNAFLPGLPRG
jgi:steroid 5-alpha reductase family enzyme